MKAVFAGMLAWAIEVSIAAILLFILKYEEDKVISRRNKK
tara:strand:+ start:10454 stop:10573 length:120 start_codon:yes stop_codon:yes gene_type:complete